MIPGQGVSISSHHQLPSDKGRRSWLSPTLNQFLFERHVTMDSNDSVSKQYEDLVMLVGAVCAACLLVWIIICCSIYRRIRAGGMDVEELGTSP
jgi:hypothetical protein